MFETQVIALALARACAKTGNRMAASIAIIAMTTRSSIKVNALSFLINIYSFFEERVAMVTMEYVRKYTE